MQKSSLSRRTFALQTATVAGLGSVLPTWLATPGASAGVSSVGHPVPREHPRLLGSRQELQALAKTRVAEYQRMLKVARSGQADPFTLMLSVTLVAAIEQNQELAKKARQMALKYVDGPIRKGHTTFATDLALSALAFDLCHEAWSAEEQGRFHQYVNQTVAANVQSETHVFHNGWYGYKNWGIGVACYAAYYENPQAQATLKVLTEDFRSRAAPALELAGAGGGWAEGYYIHYWLYEWLFFCEVARRCAGVDYYALAPRFFSQRAIASLFEMYPGIGEYNSRRAIPMGDGGGRTFGGDRDKVLSARRILVNYFRQDPAHQSAHAFNEITPRSSVGNNAYKDFLWRDVSVPAGDLKQFKLSHVSPGPGHVYARSSWEEDATHIFFKCSKRFTAHQHLDVNHFTLFKHAELLGTGGHYDEFGSVHDVNYHLRSIAHNTLLVHDPAEKWPENIRAGKVTGNDGGQHHNWPHHNGGVADVAQWRQQQKLYDIADLLAFGDTGDYVYAAGDASRAYSPQKLEFFIRQIVFLRPGTVVVFDRIKSTRPDYKKTLLWQAMRLPEQTPQGLVIKNGQGRLVLQTLLPVDHRIELFSGDNLYQYGGNTYLPAKYTGPAPECRVQVSPKKDNEVDYFLHVLTATDTKAPMPTPATARLDASIVEVLVGDVRITFRTDKVSGTIVLPNKQQHGLPEKIEP
jgi:hypothetical protein